MKFTINWLKEHLDTNASVDEIVKKLTDLGLEVESVEDKAAIYAPFRVAYVEKAEKHPDADKLRVLIVDTGKEKLQVVCGAPNARTGMKGIFAPDGSFIPGTGITLKKGVIRGQESNGMMVSEREMGLSDEHEGIIDLPENTPVGTPFTEIYGLNDVVIDVSITPNRADCTGIRGIARDLAAAGLGTLKPLDETPVKGTFKNPISVAIDFSPPFIPLQAGGNNPAPVSSPQNPPPVYGGDGGGVSPCPLFLGRYIKGVKNGPSPAWLQQKLKAVGLRPISLLVDITNFFTMDCARPLHVFDADKLKGNITVRSAKKGEKLEALNDKTYDLNEGMIAVCDESGVLGLGGIVGGVSTGVSENTVNVYVECAYFDPNRIARTGRALEVISDARYRFERGIDPEFTYAGMELATKMVLDLCGGEASDVFVAGKTPDWKRSYDFNPAYTEKLSGISVSAEKQKDILQKLGFTVQNGKASPPSWRADVQGKADLVEEIARVVGFDHMRVESIRCENAVPLPAETENFLRSKKARAALAARGLSECVTWSFMKRETAALFGSNDNPALALTNPISSDLTQMRPSILPNLIEAAQRNADRGYPFAALFEVGPAFESTTPEGQKTVAAGIRHIARGGRHWMGNEAARPVDALDARADAVAALEAAGAPAANLQITRNTPDYYHPGRSGALTLGKNVLAWFGEIHPAVLEEMGVKGPVAAFEAFLNNAPQTRKKGTAKPLVQLSPFQPVERDFAFLVDDALDTEQIVKAARSADKMIGRIDVFDIYKGKGVPDGKKSVAINVVIQPLDKTLNDAEIEGIGKKIVETVSSKCGGTLRG
jgi:phenylalanyl-tRNA synthetase beta chain